MIEATLVSKDGLPYKIESHPIFVDFPERSDARTTEATVFELHHENLIAPIIASLDGEHALSSFPKLTKALNDVVAGFPDRLDGRRVLETFIPLVRRFPEGSWVITGHENVTTKVRYLAIPTEPRYSTRSLFADPLRAGTFVSDSEPIVDLEATDLEPLERDEITIEQAMRRPRTNPDDKSSGSSSGRSRKKSPDGGKTFVDGTTGWIPPKPTEPRPKRATAVVSARIGEDAKAAIDSDPVAKRDLLEAVGRAIASGKSYAEILAAIPAP